MTNDRASDCRPPIVFWIVEEPVGADWASDAWSLCAVEFSKEAALEVAAKIDGARVERWLAAAWQRRPRRREVPERRVGLPVWPSEIDWSRVRHLDVHGWDSGHVMLSGVSPWGSYDLTVNEPHLMREITLLVREWLIAHPPTAWDADRRETGSGPVDWNAIPEAARRAYLVGLGLSVDEREGEGPAEPEEGP